MIWYRWQVDGNSKGEFVIERLSLELYRLGFDSESRQTNDFKIGFDSFPT